MGNVKALVAAVYLLAACAVALLPFLSLVGLGVHRGGTSWAVSASATLLVFGPALVAGAVTVPARRSAVMAGVLVLWSALLFQLVIPIYFPGERSDGFTSGVALLGFGSDLGRLPRGLADQLPEEPELARPAAAAAEPLDAPDVPPPVDVEALAIPYEGDGRRMAVPVVFGHDGTELEVVMMFDTGATYTTLAQADLRRLGITVGDDAPEIELHTANGVRTAQLVMVDTVWLGNLAVDNVAIATCESCASADSAGLLGLNVSGGFNLQIDADRREVLFRPRAHFDRQLDVKLFTELAATYERLPGSRVEVVVTVDNLGDREVGSVLAAVSCDEGTWQVPVGPVPPGESASERRVLPPHERCASYQLTMAEADW